MTFSSYRNIVRNTRTRETWRFCPWRTKRLDARPKCVVIVGDGFTRGFLHSQGLAQFGWTGIDNHFNLPPEVTYVPLQNDRFGPLETPMWDEKKWPRVISKWIELGPEKGRDFYSALQLEKLNADRGRGYWSFSTDGLQYELRCYLWHLFHSFDRKLDQQLRGVGIDMAVWPMASALLHVLAHFNVSLVSFNYDEILETIVRTIYVNSFGLRREPIQYFVEKPDIDPSEFPIFAIPTFKVHGSIGAFLSPNFFLGPGMTDAGQCPWICDIEIARNELDDFPTSWQRRRVNFPLIPDIVPPGRPGEDICNPNSVVVALANEQIQQADVVLFCGLSAEEPDTKEIREMVSNINRKAVVIQIGRGSNRDYANPLAQLLREREVRFLKFFDAAAAHRVGIYLAKRYGRRYAEQFLPDPKSI